MSSALRALGAALALAISSSGVAQQPATPAVDAALVRYASSADSVRLPDGRTLHMVCMGQGSPVVILTAGSSGWSENWSQIQPAVAAKTRVCAWDRAGFGLSPGVGKPQTIDQTTTDLETALKAGRIGGPYVAVGVSFGGFESLLLADREPSKVVGMVLVDPSFPDQNERLKRAAPVLTAWDSTHPPPFIAILQTCAADLRSGTLRHGGPDPQGCLHPHWPPNYPPELRAALDKAMAEAAPGTIAANLEGSQMALNSEIAIKPDRNYGDMPLIVLTAGVVQGRPDIPADLKAQVPLVQAEWRRAHEDLAALSTRGVDRVVPDSSHAGIPSAVIIETIEEVVDQARRAGR